MRPESAYVPKSLLFSSYIFGIFFKYYVISKAVVWDRACNWYKGHTKKSPPYAHLFILSVGLITLLSTTLFGQDRVGSPKNTVYFYCPQTNMLSFTDARGKQIVGTMKVGHLTIVETDIDTITVNYATQNEFSLTGQLIDFNTDRTQPKRVSGFGAYELIRDITKEQLWEYIRQADIGVFRVYRLSLKLGLKLTQESK